ncbi:MAG: OFA family MFS transporter [Syntrophaceae bacterium]
MDQSNLLHKRWRIAAAAVAMQLCLGTVYAWSIFKKPLMQAHGWSETQTQTTFMLASFMFALAVAFGGMLVDRRSPRLVGVLGGALFGGGLVLAALANKLASIGLLYVAYGLITGSGGGFGYAVPVATLIRWFPDKRGLVTGLAVMGYGFGSFLMGNIGPRLILSVGVAQTFLIWGLVSLVVVLCAMLFMHNPPPGWSASVRHATPLQAGHHIPAFRYSQALRTPQLWILWLILFLNVTAGLGLISQLSPMAQDVMKSEAGAVLDTRHVEAIAILSGMIVAVAAVFNGLGRLAWSWISDVWGRKQVFTMVCLTQAAGFFLLAHSATTMVFAVMVCYLLACYGGTLACMPAFAADEFGSLHIGKIYGTIFTACGLAGLAGPYLFAEVKTATGSFAGALVTESVLLCLSTLLVMAFRKPSMRAAHEAPSD